jgi:MoaA/NifB/PqqE/SkfB family radical SAM enzyme
MAFYRKSREEEMNGNEIIELINRLPRSKIKEVYFFGGEPLLRNDIFKLINCARRRRFRTLLDTNGGLLNEEVVNKLRNAGLTRLGVSIDSPYPEIHDKLRGQQGLFERAIEGIKYCLDKKITCYFSTYATKENLKNGDLKKIILLGEKLGVSHVRVLSSILMGRWLDKEDFKLNQEERELLKSFRQFGFVFLEENSCNALRKKLFYISPYGEVQPCCYIPISFGNIKKEPLEKILKKMWKHPIFNTRIKEECPVNNEEFQKKYFSKITPSTKLPIDL